MVGLIFFTILFFLALFLLSIFLKPILPLPDILKKTQLSHLFHSNPAQKQIDREKKKLEKLSVTGALV